MGIRKYGFTRGLTCLIFVFILCGCASIKGIADKSGGLSSEDRRKFDYFYLEAERLKAIGENDAAFDLMSPIWIRLVPPRAFSWLHII